MEAQEVILAVGDIVETTNCRLRYRVARITKTKKYETLIVCAPITQRHWSGHFFFAPEFLEKVEMEVSPNYYLDDGYKDDPGY